MVLHRLHMIILLLVSAMVSSAGAQTKAAPAGATPVKVTPDKAAPVAATPATPESQLAEVRKENQMLAGELAKTRALLVELSGKVGLPDESTIRKLSVMEKQLEHDLMLSARQYASTRNATTQASAKKKMDEAAAGLAKIRQDRVTKQTQWAQSLLAKLAEESKSMPTAASLIAEVMKVAGKPKPPKKVVAD